MRTRSPCLRTLPSIRLATPASDRLQQNRRIFPEDERRAAADHLSSGIFAKNRNQFLGETMEKYSLLGSPLVLTSGNTAIDFCGFDAVANSLNRGGAVPSCVAAEEKQA